MKSIFHRISVRKYRDIPVEQEKIEKLMRAAMAAPSATNRQPWEFYVITDKDTIKRLSGSHEHAGFAVHAPLIIVPCYRKDTRYPMFSDIDLSAAVENLLLEADYLGLGATWTGVSPLPARMQAVRDILKLPENLEAFALIPVGYPAEERPQQDRYEPERVHYI